MAIGTFRVATPARLPWRARLERAPRPRVVPGPGLRHAGHDPDPVLWSPIPFCMALYFSLSNAFIGRPSHFIGLTQLHQPVGQPTPSGRRSRTPSSSPASPSALQARAGDLAGPAAQRAALVQAADPGRGAAAVGHPDRAVDARLVVDVQLALQRGELDRHRAAASSIRRARTGSARSTTRWRR